ncbi:hypothetical protein KPP03845_100047 [Streptomyces xanthophaeus]|uniref:hypothetical protein n=1 Tax=Streptomyces xanthophaeus TaxID=67385 RepID=UPI00233EC867|nr:hypothetical protein [Streptomyces xanthophaeus]WCD83728.1 hypothetical protein KPP03845_100047 [Streptomyces xanthophaeus]
MLTSLELRSKRVEDLRPLSGLPLDLSLDGCHDGNGQHVIGTSGPCARSATADTPASTGDKHPALSAFGDAPVVGSLGARGVDLSFDW